MFNYVPVITFPPALSTTKSSGSSSNFHTQKNHQTIQPNISDRQKGIFQELTQMNHWHASLIGLIRSALAGTAVTLEEICGTARVAESQELTTGLTILNTANCSLDRSDALGTDKTSSTQNVKTCANTPPRSATTRKGNTSVCDIRENLSKGTQDWNTERASHLGQSKTLERLSSTELNNHAAL